MMQRVFVYVVMLCAVISCAGPFLSGGAVRVDRLELEHWRELRSPDFILYSRGPEENLKALALDLARYVAVVERLVESQPPKKVARIFLVREEATEIFMPSTFIAGYMNHSLAGYGGFMRSATHDPNYRNLLLHEFSHYLNLRGAKLSYPTWYTEGYAEFLGSIRTRDDVMEVGSAPPYNLLRLEDRRLAKKDIDLAEIFSFQRDGRTPDPRDLYPIAWAVVHYLNSNPHRREQMLAMLRDQADGVHWKRAYDRWFSEPIELLSKRVSQHAELMRHGAPSATAYLPLDSLDVRVDWVIRDVSPNEILRLFGDAALRGVVYTRGGSTSNMRLANGLFRKALEFDPDDSESRAGLAATLAVQSDFDGAETQLALFRQDPEPSIPGIVHAADAMRSHAISLNGEGRSDERGELYASAIRLYRRALESEPDSAFALAGLGHSQLETKDFEAARESFAAAEIAGEWDADLTLAQGLVERELGKFAEARSLWREVLRLGSEDEAKRASELLEESPSG